MKKVLVLAASLMTLSMFASNNDGQEAAAVVDTQAPSVVTGCIVDKTTGEALAGVKVVLANNTVTYTDFDGKFSFNNVAPGKQAIATSFVSYKNNMINVPVLSSATAFYKIQLESQK